MQIIILNESVRLKNVRKRILMGKVKRCKMFGRVMSMLVREKEEMFKK